MLQLGGVGGGGGGGNKTFKNVLLFIKIKGILTCIEIYDVFVWYNRLFDYFMLVVSAHGSIFICLHCS